MRRAKLLLAVLTPLFIAAYLIWFARDARLSYFDGDDCMTLYRAWSNSAAALLKANVIFFLNSPFYRPMTCVWYRLVYDFAGFHPVPFHIAHLLNIAVNTWFAYCVARRLSGSRETGALAALLISYHGSFISLYVDTEYAYDVTCFLFYFAALAFYLRARSRTDALGWKDLLALGALDICALNCKELAATLPITLLIYELVYHLPALGSWRKIRAWSLGSGRGVLLTGILAFLFVVGRTNSSGLIANPEFQPVFSWNRFMESSGAFLSELAFQKGTLAPAAVLLTWLVLFAIAWAAKSRPLKFAWLFIMFSVIPVAFIPPRGPGQYYIPLFGWVLYAATALVQGTSRLLEALPRVSRFQMAREVLLFLATAAVMYPLNTRAKWSEQPAVALEGELYRSIVQQTHRLRPALHPGARVLFLDDPITDRWQMTLLMRLSYADDRLVIDQAKFMPAPPTPSQVASYDYVFDYVRGRFYASPRARAGDALPDIVLEWGRSEFYHLDWTPVTPDQPAARGEVVIAKMTNLGDTRPPAPKNQPFPSEPFLPVASSVEVRVGGQPAEVQLKIGWPREVNEYRVDFRIPDSVRPGRPDVVVTCENRTGPATPIPVR